MKPVLWLTLIIALRFLGLFIVMPLLSWHALHLEGGTAMLAGIAVGGYALVQMFFQYPFGKMGDRIGRKRVILFGLALFAAGSVVCAVSDSVYLLILGRFLQGAGAISSTITATISDLVGEEKRAHAMAMMGGGIAMSFAVAMLAGPLIGGYLGVDKLFWLTALLSLLAMLLLLKVPTPPKIHHHSDDDMGANLSKVFRDRNMMRMNFTMLLHSATMTIAFFMIPIVLTQEYGWEAKNLWQIYLPALVLGILSMGPAAVLGEKKNLIKEVFIAAIAVLLLAFLLIGLVPGESAFIAGVMLLFIGINSLEPLLQSTASKFARAAWRGAALGLFNSFQFLGVFLGGTLGGYLLHHYHVHALALLLAATSLFWLGWTFTMPRPLKAAFASFPLEGLDLERFKTLEHREGIADLYLNREENVAVVKYDKTRLTREALEELLFQHK